MSRIQQPSPVEIEQFARMQKMQQEEQQLLQMNNEFRGMCGALFKEVAAIHLESADEDEDAEFFERLSIRCLNAAKAYHAVFGIFHTDDPLVSIANVKKALAEHAEKKLKPQKGKIATE